MMKEKKGRFLKKFGAGLLAVMTAFMMSPDVFTDLSSVSAASSDNMAHITAFSYTNGSVQTYTVPDDGLYIIEAKGAKGGDSGEDLGYGIVSRKGGAGGYVKGSLSLKKGDILYIYVGKVGLSLGDQNIVTSGNINGAGSGGGGSFSGHMRPGDTKRIRVGDGGGATEVRLNGTGTGNRLMVAGGGGGGISHHNGQGVAGGDGGAATSGNAQTSQGLSAGSSGAGGGGGYRGGLSGSLTVPATGGSNFAANSLTIAINGTNPVNEGSSVTITQCSNNTLIVDPNDGIWNGTDKPQTFTLNQSYDFTRNFPYTGGIQTFTVPYTGYYHLHTWGGQGGKDANRGGYGGYMQSYTYLTQGQVLSVAVGGEGWQQDGKSYNGSRPGGYNGGAGAGQTGSSGNYSGTGGGATHIALNNNNAGGNNPLTGYRSCPDQVLIVAGGGAGGSANSCGGGGDVMYVGNGSNWPGSVANGAGTGLLNGQFGVGSNPGSIDGGGGGGGWVGGQHGNDSGSGISGGGGASFVNTKTVRITQNGLSFDGPLSIPVELKGDTCAGTGRAMIQFLSDTVVIPNPTRPGYTFLGWEHTGNGSLETTNLGVVKFQYGKGQTVLRARWQKNTGTSELSVNPNGGVYNNSTEISTHISSKGKTQSVAGAMRYGYAFTGYTYQRLAGSDDAWNGSSVYTYGTETTARLTANYKTQATNLTIDPNGGIYKGSTNKEYHNNLSVNSSAVPVGTPTRTGYIFQYWDEINKSDGSLAQDGWHAGTKDGYLRAVWTPITYTVHYEPNCPAGLTLTGTQPNQTHTYDQPKALASNAEYNDPTGYKIPNVKFLWWNTKPDGSGKIYKSGETVMNLTAKQGDVINLYAQWMVTYTIEHYTENLDGTYKLANTDEYKLVPLTTWTAPLHEYPGWSQPESKPFVVATTDTTLKFYYPLIHYKLSYDLKGGEWFEEQPDGSWIAVAAPPSEYTVLTPDVHITRPDKVGFTYLGWTGTEVPNQTLDVVIPKGSLGDRSYVAHWEAQPYDVDIPVSVLFSVGHDGDASGVFDQNGDGNESVDGFITNHSLFPVQMTSITFENEGDFVFTHDKTLDETHPNIMDWRLDIQNKGEWNQYAPELLSGIKTEKNDIFWMAQNSKGQMKLNVNNAWAMHDVFDIKEPMKIGRIVYTFDIGHRLINSRSVE